MSFKRKIKRKNQQRKRKFLEKSLRKVLELTTSMPKKCRKCNKPFEEGDDLDKWDIDVNKNNATLICEDCKGLEDDVIKSAAHSVPAGL